MICRLNKHNMFVKLLALYFVSLVFGAMNIGIIGSLLKFIAFLPAFWWLLTKHSITLSRALLSAIFFLGFASLSVFWSIDVSSSLVQDVGTLSLLILLCVSSGYKYSAQDIEFLKKALVWSSRITAIVVLFTGGSYESRIVLNGLLTEDPNYLCTYYLFVIANATELILSSAKHTHKWIYILEMGLYLMLVIASGSRGGTLAITMAIAVIVIGSLIQNKVSFKTLFLLVLLTMVVLGLVLLSPYVLPENVLRRFYIQEIIDSRGTGRYQIWQDYLHVFGQSSIWRQLIGYGAGGLPELAKLQRLNKIIVSHNVFVERLIGVGIVGLMLFISMLWQFFKITFIKRDLFSMAVFVGILGIFLSTSFGGKPYWNILIYIICLKQFIVYKETNNEKFLEK